MNRTKRGFTLVEILIVVIILGILAAIVIPQFTEASDDARDSSLVSDLQTLRSQVELYKIQHRDMPPGYKRNADGSWTAFSAADFRAQLLGQTDVDGVVAAGSALGPYLQDFPTNPFVDANADQIKAIAADPTSAAPGDGTTGWAFNTVNEKVWPNDVEAEHYPDP